MSVIKIRMNSAGARTILNSRGVQQDLLRRAERIKEKANGMGNGVYAADVKEGKVRAHAMVKTTDAHSMASNKKHNSLLKSLNAGK
jgi:hypothetical protein